MGLTTIFALICLIYGLILIFTGFTKNGFMIKMVKIKFSKDTTDEKAVKILYLFGLLLLVTSVVLFMI